MWLDKLDVVFWTAGNEERTESDMGTRNPVVMRTLRVWIPSGSKLGVKKINILIYNKTFHFDTSFPWSFRYQTETLD